MKGYISPSTQEHNKTALGNTEENIMHKVADELVPLLKSAGLEILRGEKTDTLTQMVRQSNLFNADFHVAIHSNAYDGKSRGCEIFHFPNSAKGKKLAESIYKYIEPLTPTADRKVKEHAGYYELKETNAPAVIVEVDFHDNYEGAKWIDENIFPIAEAIAKGICDYCGIPYKDDPYKLAIEQIKKIVTNL
jgi:N-acetylmuramoyl-L-alanine amidase